MTAFTQIAERPVTAFPIVDADALVAVVRRGMKSILYSHGLGRVKAEEKSHPFRRDLSTKVDHRLERYYFRSIRRLIPDASIIGEEGSKHVGPHGMKFRCTLDGIDGTNAFVEKRLRHVGTVITILWYDPVAGRDVVLAVVIGLVGRQEVVVYARASASIEIVSQNGARRRMTSRYEGRPFNEGRVLLRRPLGKYPRRVRRAVGKFWEQRHMYFRDSLSVWAVSLITSFGAGLLSTDSNATPQDSSPVFGLLEAAGFGSYRLNRGVFVPCPPEYPVTTYRRPYEIFFLRETALSKTF